MADIKRDYDTPEHYEDPMELGPSPEAIAIVEEFDDNPTEYEELRGIAHFTLGAPQIMGSNVNVMMYAIKREHKLMAKKAVDALLNAGFRYTGRST